MNKFLSTATFISALSLTLPALAQITPGPEPLNFTGKIDNIHCGMAACQFHIPTWPLTKGWIGVDIRPTDSLAVALTKANKWSTVVSAYNGNHLVTLTFSITGTSPTAACNPFVCDGLSLVTELQDVEE